MEKSRVEVVYEARHRGPHLGAVSIVFTVLSLASVAAVAIPAGGGQILSPFGPPGAAQAFFQAHGAALRLAAFFGFGAAIPLGIFTATAVSRLEFLGVNVAGVFISLFGGLAASLMLMISALSQWALGQPGVAAQTSAERVLHLLDFATGGVGYVAGLGLLLAGVSVIALFTRLLPRWVAWLGLAVAAIAEASALSLLVPQLAYLLPLARFPAFIWFIAAGILMPRSRAELQKRNLRPAEAAA